MDTRGFTSGVWEGCYKYALFMHRTGSMRVMFSFENGRIRGEGTDPVGPFSVAGEYDEESRSVHFQKTYPGQHAVRYEGQLHDDGIRGRWSLGWLWRGTFHLWLVKSESRTCSSCQQSNVMSTRHCSHCGAPLD